MGLSDYLIKSQDNRWNSELNVEQWVLTYSIPSAKLQAEAPNLRVSLTNLLPGADATDTYAPCIHRVQAAPDPADANAHAVSVLYQRPTTDMLLQPGRGLLNHRTYSTTKREETAVFTESRDLIRQMVSTSSSTSLGSYLSSVERRDVLTVEERGLVVLRLADWAVKELDLYKVANTWMGMGGEFTIGGNKFDNLKLAAVDISRKDSDASVVLSTWQFARNPDGWGQSGIVSEEWIAFDWEGNELVYDPDADPPVIPRYSASGERLYYFPHMKLRNLDSEVVRGFTDFSAMEAYFLWMTP